MAVFTVIATQRADDYGVVQTLTSTDIQPGQSITLAGLGDGLDGTFTVLFCPEYAFDGVDGDTGEWMYDVLKPRENQLLFYDAGDNKEWGTVVPPGTCTWTLTCTWVNNAAVEEYLGVSFTAASDTGYLTKCVAAANAFAYRRRYEAGYLQDSLTTSPGGDVTLGTIMIAAAYFRQRGAYNSLANFDGMGMMPPPGITPMIMQLLGINRPQVA